MKTLSVLLTLALFLAANGLAAWLKFSAVKPAQHGPTNVVSKTQVYGGNRAIHETPTRKQFYE